MVTPIRGLMITSAQILGARSPRQLNFIYWRLIFVCRQNGGNYKGRLYTLLVSEIPCQLVSVQPVTRGTENASHSAVSSVYISEVKGRILVFYRALLTGRINCSERVYKRESKLASE